MQTFRRVAFRSFSMAASPIRRLRRRFFRSCARRLRTHGSLGRPLTVVVEVSSLHSGGLETVVRDLVLALDRTRIRPVVACVDSAGPIAQQIEAGGVPVHVIGRSRSGLSWLLERERADILNSHYSLFGISAAIRLGVPQVHVLHNSYLWLDDGGARRFAWAFRDVDHFVAVSSSVASYAKGRFGLADVTVIPNGIDLSLLRLEDRAGIRSTTRTELGLGSAFVFLCLARYEPRKAQLALIQAFSRVASKIPDAALVLAGDTSDQRYVDACQRAASACHLDGRVRLLPYERDAARLFAAADAFVLPSIVEGASISALQAAASGLPLILTNTGAASELLDGQAAGILVRPFFDALSRASPPEIQAAETAAPEHVLADLARALLLIGSDRSEWKRKATQAASAYKRLTATEMAHSYADLFDEVRA